MSCFDSRTGAYYRTGILVDREKRRKMIREERASFLVLHHVQLFQEFFFLLRVPDHALELVDVVFHILQIPGQKDAALVQKTDVIADIL